MSILNNCILMKFFENLKTSTAINIQTFSELIKQFNFLVIKLMIC